MLIGGYSGDKGDGSGIAVLDGDQIVKVIPAESPSWLAMHPSLPVLYAVAEIDEGRVHAWLLANGVPTTELGSGQTGGSEPAHLAVDPSGRFLITANYTGGSISVHHLGADGGIGERSDFVQHEMHGAHPRQEGAHPHMVLATPDRVLIVDLGGDAIYNYRLSEDGRLERDSVITAPTRSGPRHLLAASDRYYVTAELSGQVLVFEPDGQFVGAVPASTATGPNQPSEIVSNGRFLYVGNRGPDTVSVFALDSDLPRYITEVPTGTWPRHIALDGDRLYIANERSHEVTVLRIDEQTGVPAHERTIAVPSPTFVLP
ncbi:MAG TPA: lactonase family protein [Streptosporangiaceae bacterium]|nr:lactonase family protein [Streptosporangiaceae bacterium]